MAPNLPSRSQGWWTVYQGWLMPCSDKWTPHRLWRFETIRLLHRLLLKASHRTSWRKNKCSRCWIVGTRSCWRVDWAVTRSPSKLQSPPIIPVIQIIQTSKSHNYPLRWIIWWIHYPIPVANYPMPVLTYPTLVVNYPSSIAHTFYPHVPGPRAWPQLA